MRIKEAFCVGIALLFVSAVQSASASVNIFIQPQNQAVLVGSNAVFTASVTTSAGETITGYTWLRSTNSQGPFSAIPGVNSSVLTISNATLSDSGFYFLRVNHQAGTNAPAIAASTLVTLTVQDQARVTGHPSGLTRIVGASATFGVAATGGAPLGYQWRFSGTNLIDGPRVVGANSTNLTVSSLRTNDTGDYDVIVTNSYSGATSQVAVLTVLMPPAVTIQPGNVTTLIGSNVTLAATVEGSPPLAYRWRKGGINLNNGGRIIGATNHTLIITGAVTNDSGNYSLFITNVIGSTNSLSALVTVLAPPVITSATNAIGRQGAPFTFSITATGSPPITFSADSLPEGLTLVATNGLISGIPAVSGNFEVAIFASNAAVTTTGRLALTLTTGIPGITSPLAAVGQQGEPFNYTITATNDPTVFSALDLPDGLSLDSTNGAISGVPAVSGLFAVTIGASNRYGAASRELTLTLTTGIPGVDSGTNAAGKQGEFFTYTITASNRPVYFSAIGLPAGLNFDPATGVISGPPIESGLFSVIIGAHNQYGSDSRLLSLTITSSVPVITSALAVAGTEGQSDFTYAITATENPISYGALGLPVGLAIDPNTGLISGTLVYGGTNEFLISARNAWGVGTNTLQIVADYSPLPQLVITDLTWTYAAPYLLDFTFSLQTDRDPIIGEAVVRPPDQIGVVCLEGNLAQETRVPIANETDFVLTRGLASNAKLLKTFFVMDYTYSMFISPGAIDAMESAVKNLINLEPGTAQFAVNEFHAESLAPTLVTDFTSDKVLTARAIEGIRTNIVQGNYAGSRLYDALSAAITKFGPANKDEQRYLILMSDGHDDASVLGGVMPDAIIRAAVTARVQVYCVGYGPNANTSVLQPLANGTRGRYFAAANANEVAAQFTLLLKDLNSQYFLRWATLQRGAAFQPMFQVTVDGVTTTYNFDFPEEIEDDSVVPQTMPPTMKTVKIDRSRTPPTTNHPSVFAPDFNPRAWSNNVHVGALRLVTDSVSNVSSVTLRAFYTPRFVRELRLHYRANYPCIPSLLSSGPGDLLGGWSLTETNDGAGGQWVTLRSPNPSNNIPYGIRGDLVKFQFQRQAVPSGQEAFSLFEVDNSIYTNALPLGRSFTLETNLFITVYPPTPPLGTPVPWLFALGYTNDLDLAELSDPTAKGLPLWQQYRAGLDPNDPDSVFAVRSVVAAGPGIPNEITFSTVPLHTYRVESATTLGIWSTLLDGIEGTGGDITLLDGRNLSGVTAVYYRIAVY